MNLLYENSPNRGCVYLVLTGGQRPGGAGRACVAGQGGEVLERRGVGGRGCQHPLIVVPGARQVALATVQVGKQEVGLRLQPSSTVQISLFKEKHINELQNIYICKSLLTRNNLTRQCILAVCENI